MLDPFSGGFPNEGAVVSTDIAHDGIIKTITTNAGRGRVDHPIEGNDPDFAGPTANIKHHGPLGFIHGKPSANGRRHGFFNEIDLTSTGP